MMSLPSYNRMHNPRMSLNDTMWERVLVKMKEPTNREHVQKVISELKGVFTPEQSNNMDIWDHFDNKETLDLV